MFGDDDIDLDLIENATDVREAPTKMLPKAFGHCPFGGEGGSKPLPGWFGATFFGRISFILGGSRPLPGWFGALFPR